MPAQTYETTTPTEADALLARESLRRLSHYLGGDRADLRIRIPGRERAFADITLPSPAYRLLTDVLAEMANGQAVTLVPVRAELTTQQAASVLHVSRPYLIGLLEEGKIPFRLVGQHRRLRVDDLMAYKRKHDDVRPRVVDKQTAGAQELDVGSGDRPTLNSTSSPLEPQKQPTISA